MYSGAFLTLCCKYSCKMHTVDLPAGFSTQSFLDFLTIFCLKGLFWSPAEVGSSCSSSKTGIDIILVPSGNAGRLCLDFSESSPTPLDLDFLYSLIVWSRSWKRKNHSKIKLPMCLLASNDFQIYFNNGINLNSNLYITTK